jgi:hypothetical protein
MKRIRTTGIGWDAEWVVVVPARILLVLFASPSLRLWRKLRGMRPDSLGQTRCHLRLKPPRHPQAVPGLWGNLASSGIKSMTS